MAGKQIQRRRGTTAQHASFTGAPGELTVDLNKDTVVVHDGTTPGGFPMAREDLANTDASKLKYTPEGDGAVATDVQSAIRALTFDSVAAMKAAPNLKVGMKARTLGYYAAGDGGGCDYEIVAAGTGANFGFLYEQLTASGFEAKLLGGGIAEDKTAYIPSDYGTLQFAFDDLSKVQVNQGVSLTIHMESGYEVPSGTNLVSGDYSHFTVTATDAVVNVSTSFPSTDNLFLVGNADGPRISAFFDMLDLGTHGFVVTRRSTLEIDAGAGVQNAGRTGILVLTGSSLSATGAISRYCNGRNLECTAASVASIQDADLRGGNKSGLYIGANYARRGSLVNAQGSDFSDTNNDCVSANRGSTFNAMEGIFNNVARCGFAQSGGIVILDGASISDCGAVGTSEYGGQMTINNLVATNVSGTQAIRTRSGGRVHGINASISGLAGSVVNGSNALFASGASEIHVTESTLSHFDRPLLASEASVVRCPSSDLSTGNERASSVFSGGHIYVHLTTTPNSLVAGAPSTADFNVANFNVIGTNGAVFG